VTLRKQTHVIDTLAIRAIISVLPENWLVRGLEERDYGIDLSIELYDGENPTGCVSLIQVKGTSKSFNEPIKLYGFPTKTLEYAQLFPESFFIFHTSVSDKKTYFVWAQKYIETRLVKDTPGWADQDSNTIYFPEENVLGSVDGNSKIEKIMRLLSAKKNGLDFLADYEWLCIHWDNYKVGEQGVLPICIEIVKKLKRHKLFYSVYLHDFMQINLTELLNYLEVFNDYPISSDGYESDEEAERITRVDRQMLALNGLKMTFLGQSEMDHFEEEYSSTSPY
jgi:Domain of unknown function (DUF4365)